MEGGGGEFKLQWRYVLYISIFSGGDYFNSWKSFVVTPICCHLFLIEFRTLAVCKFVDVECVTRSTLDNEYYDLKPLSFSSGIVCYECDDRNNNSLGHALLKFNRLF